MAFYHALPSFDDAAPAWHDLNAIQGVECWILSNGTREVCFFEKISSVD
jgi:hypothetical protein